MTDIVAALFGAFLLFLLWVLVIILFGGLLAIPIYILWNLVIPGLFALPQISYLQAWGLTILCAFLFKTFPTSRSSK